MVALGQPYRSPTQQRANNTCPCCAAALHVKSTLGRIRYLKCVNCGSNWKAAGEPTLTRSRREQFERTLIVFRVVSLAIESRLRGSSESVVELALRLGWHYRIQSSEIERMLALRLSELAELPWRETSA